jgi:predicted dithiol-disulfide oxidoreductase (DUF899 family)
MKMYNVDMTCKVCGEFFHPNTWNQTFCSYECYREWNRDKSRARYEKLQEKLLKDELEKTEKLDPNYIKRMQFLKKLAEKQQEMPYIEIKKNKHFEASGCDGTEYGKKLIIHHKSYSPIEVVTLCTSCHALLHHCFLNGKKVRYGV